MEVPFNNKKILAKFDYIVDTFHNLCEKDGIDLSNPKLQYIAQTTKVSQYLNDPEKIRALALEPELRNGYLPNALDYRGFPIDYRFISVEHIKNELMSKEWLDYYEYGKFDLPIEIGTASSALFVHYPNNGLTGWHTNWNANAYQILFTWSETGDGFFSYWDKQQNKVVTVQDKPGWQCRWYYFGRKDEPEHHCWHTCYSGNSRRMTLAFKFSNEGKHSEKDSNAQLLRDELIAEISSD